MFIKQIAGGATDASSTLHICLPGSESEPGRCIMHEASQPLITLV